MSGRRTRRPQSRRADGTTLDWLSELWQVLYLRARRTPGILVSQAEWQTRLLSAAADQMRRAAVGDTHRRAVAR